MPFQFFLFLTFIIALNDGLQIYLGPLSWVPLLLFVLFYFRPRILLGVYSVIWLFFICIVLLNSLVSDDPINVLVRALKFFLIFFFLTIMYKGDAVNRMLHPLMVAIYFSILINVFFIIAALSLDLSNLAWVGGGFRWETFFARPGTLYFSGSAFILIFTYDFFFKTGYIRLNAFFSIFMLFMSLLVVFLDGSRTAFIALICGIITIVAFSRSTVLKLKFISCCLVIFIPLLIFLTSYDFINFNRFFSLAESTSFYDADPIRFKLLVESIDWILTNNPVFFGNGFSSTINAHGFQFVVHNAFLLVLEKLGLLALVLYALIVLSPIFTVVFRCLTFLPNRFFQNNFYLVFVFWFMFFTGVMFHPLSTEFGPWFFYIISVLFANRNMVR
ncbi:hypothetical protein D2923_14390 [Vibrio cholerae]|nr:hypothetical protein D2923_14390 [Vibrio cholerae]